MKTVLTNGTVYPGASAIAFEDGRVIWVGDHPPDGADEVIDLDGRLVTPAFVDAHAHSGMTGFQLLGVDLAGITTLAACLDAVRDHASTHDGVVIGYGWDETGWPEGRVPHGRDLERAAPGRLVYIARVDGHSAIVSPALAARVDGLAGQPGWSADGRVERAAHHAVRDAVAALTPPTQRRAAIEAALRSAASYGIGALHELGAPHICPADDMLTVRDVAASVGLHVTTYWGELGAFHTARELGVAGLAGDLVADGAVGSRTAAMSEPYADAPDTCGHAYLTADEVAEHVVGCTTYGLQAGFHCIGDAGVGAVVEGIRIAAEKIDLGAARHRLEHVEMIDASGIEILAGNSVIASVQPMFDGLWGGPDGMYATRLGGRALGMNPYAALARAGVPLAFGSDSPVTSFGPWEAIRAAVWHHNPEQRIPFEKAFAAHTIGGWRAARVDDAGMLQVGAPATYAVWDSAIEPDGPPPVCQRTVVNGRTVFDREPR